MAKPKEVVARQGNAPEAWTEQYCPLDLPEFQERDVLNFKRTINYPVTNLDNDRREIIVEVDIHLRYIRETNGLVLGDPIYSHTLLPGERVRLATTDRRSRFSYDNESNLSYKSVQMSESQYYMSSLRHFSADSEATQSGSSSSDYNNNWDFHGDAEGGLGFFSVNAETNARGSFNSHSAKEYINNQKYHAESAVSNSVEATQKNMSTSMGEVNTRNHAEGESESHFESSAREFRNENRCHAVTYMFYQVNKKQTVAFEIVSVEFRIKDPNSLTSISHLPPGNRKLKLIPQQLPVSSERVLKALEIENSYQRTVNVSDNIRTTGFSTNFSTLNVNVVRPTYEVDIRQLAIRRAMEEFMEQGIIDRNGEITKEFAEQMNFKRESAIPTAGVVVKGYLDECDTCEPLLKRSYELEVEHRRLQNELLSKQIELLEKSQEYRCCPCDDEEEDNDD